jgi:Transmembrane protein 131-like
MGPFEEVEASNLILSSWLSHGKAAASSLLVNQLVLFPPVQIGSHIAQPITVKNPGPIPALIQLVLNSEELITDCKPYDDDPSEHTLPNRSPEIGPAEMRFGFSVEDSGLMEVVLHPFESASLGPVIFHPSSRCTWFSSALVRSNITGIEWVSLHASGVSHSISLLDGSEPVWKLELELDSDPIKNIPSSLQSEVKCPSCEHQFSKVIFAKNTGELPLKIKKIRVSGTDCRSDGFTISRNCLGFNLLPGESELIEVSYRPDFYSGMVHRDLELVMAGGIFVIPMKVHVPVCMVGQCRKTSVFWRVSLLLFAAIFFAVVLVFVRVMPLSSESSEYYFHLDNGERCAGQDDKRLFSHHSTKGSRYPHFRGLLFPFRFLLYPFRCHMSM